MEQTEGNGSNVMPEDFVSEITFSVPDDVEMRLAHGRWQWWVERFGSGLNEPAGLAALSVFRDALSRQTEALTALAQDIGELETDPQAPGYKLMEIAHSFYELAEDLNDLLKFTSLTLPYDPGTIRAIERAKRVPTGPARASHETN